MCPHLGCPPGWARGQQVEPGAGLSTRLRAGQRAEERGVEVVGRVQTSPDGSWALLELLTMAGEPLGLQDPEVPLGRSRPGSVLALLLSLGLGAAGPVSQVSEAACTTVLGGDRAREGPGISHTHQRLASRGEHRLGAR